MNESRPKFENERTGPASFGVPEVRDSSARSSETSEQRDARYEREARANSEKNPHSAEYFNLEGDELNEINYDRRGVLVPDVYDLEGVSVSAADRLPQIAKTVERSFKVIGALDSRNSHVGWAAIYAMNNDLGLKVTE